MSSPYNHVLARLSAVVPHSRSILFLDVVVLAIALFAAAGLYHRKTRNPMGLPYPPGPKPSWVPLVGNIPDMPTSEGSFKSALYTSSSERDHLYDLEWLKFTQWGKDYGSDSLEYTAQSLFIHSMRQGLLPWFK